MRRLVPIFFVLTSVLASAQVINPPQWSSSTSYLAGGLVRASDGNYYRALHNSTGSNPIADNHTNWELYYVRASTTLVVAASGARFSSLLKAWAMVQSATIAAPAKVTIQISSSKTGTYAETFAGEINLNSPCGSRISIAGDQVTNITLTFPLLSNGFTLTGGNTFGGISKVSIQGTKNDGLDGIFVDSGSTLLQTSIEIQGFQNGVFADNLSKVICSGTAVTFCSNEGFGADKGSRMECENTSVDAVSASYGYVASGGSFMDATGASARSANYAGFIATTLSNIVASPSTSEINGYGYRAIAGGTIFANKCVCQSQLAYGFEVETGGRISSVGATLGGNMTGDYNIAPNTPQSDLSLITN